MGQGRHTVAGTSQSAEWGLQRVPIVPEQVAKPGFNPQGLPLVT